MSMRAWAAENHRDRQVRGMPRGEHGFEEQALRNLLKFNTHLGFKSILKLGTGQRDSIVGQALWQSAWGHLCATHGQCSKLRVLMEETKFSLSHGMIVYVENSY